MDAKKITLKKQLVAKLYLINENGTEKLGEYTFPEGTQVLYIDNKIFGRLIDIHPYETLLEWGETGQEVWIADYNEK